MGDPGFCILKHILDWRGGSDKNFVVCWCGGEACLRLVSIMGVMGMQAANSRPRSTGMYEHTLKDSASVDVWANWVGGAFARIGESEVSRCCWRVCV